MSRSRFQVLPFTLSELFALLFFVLAIALVQEAWKRNQAEAGIAELEEVLAPLGADGVQVVSQLLDPDGRLSDDFHELVRTLADQDEWRPEVERQLREAGRDSARVAGATTPELIQELVELQEETSERAEVLEELFAGLDETGGDPVEQLITESARLERENQDLTAQVENMVRRNGLDHPPCWADPEGGIEYAFEASIHTAHVDLRPIWPARRNQDAEGVPGMLAAAGEGLSYEEFSRRALPILRDSQQRNPQCRHFVRVLDRVAGGKEPFKEGLLTVERFFYKLLVD